jgi:ribosomal protein S18 acetylase RimI-like enzyme
MHFLLPGESDERCIAFLRFGFTSNHGMFSWRHHYVACAPDGVVLAEISVHDHSDALLDVLHLIWMLLRFFGLFKTVKILLRGLVLQNEQPAPQRGQILIKSYSIDKRVQGSNVGRMMFMHAVSSGWLRFPPNTQYLLNVRQDNRARHLYERLGFVTQPRQRPPSARLPAELVSVRMVWSEQGVQSARDRSSRQWGPPAQEPATVPDTAQPGQPFGH